MTALGFFEAQIRRISPPWLARRIGGAYMRALGQAIDTQATRAADGVRARFPGLAPEDALGYIGKDRQIIRGPEEPSATYARRLRIWWESHRTRGGPYALLGQLFAFWFDSLDVPIDVIGNTGTRYAMDVDGVIVRDRLTWSRTLFDGGAEWSKIWIFFYMPESVDVAVVTDSGDLVITDGDEVVVASLPLSSGLTDSIEESFLLVPRAWSAAHIKRTTIVLLYGLGRLWDYPTPVPTWDEWEDSGATWNDPAPIQYVIEG